MDKIKPQQRPNYDFVKYNTAAIVTLFLLGIYYTFFTAIASFILNFIISHIFSKECNSYISTIYQLMIIAGFMSILSYFLIHLVSKIPEPLHGYGGFDKHDLSELHGAIMIAFVFLTFQKRFRNLLFRLAINLNFDPQIDKMIYKKLT